MSRESTHVLFFTTVFCCSLAELTSQTFFGFLFFIVLSLSFRYFLFWLNRSGFTRTLNICIPPRVMSYDHLQLGPAYIPDKRSQCRM